MRRAGQNPTDVEVKLFDWIFEIIIKPIWFNKLTQVHDMINKIDNGSGVLDFQDFLNVRFFKLKFDFI